MSSMWHAQRRAGFESLGYRNVGNKAYHDALRLVNGDHSLANSASRQVKFSGDRGKNSQEDLSDIPALDHSPYPGVEHDECGPLFFLGKPTPETKQFLKAFHRSGRGIIRAWLMRNHKPPGAH